MGVLDHVPQEGQPMNKQGAFELLIRIYLERAGAVYRDDIGVMDLSKCNPISLAALAKQLVDHS
jgi:hypothetical protein